MTESAEWQGTILEPWPNSRLTPPCFKNVSHLLPANPPLLVIRLAFASQTLGGVAAVSSGARNLQILCSGMKAEIKRKSHRVNEATGPGTNSSWEVEMTLWWIFPSNLSRNTRLNCLFLPWAHLAAELRFLLGWSLCIFQAAQTLGEDCFVSHRLECYYRFILLLSTLGAWTANTDNKMWNLFLLQKLSSLQSV